MGRAAFGWLAAVVMAGAPMGAGAEENGVRVGDGRLHPFMEVESRYDSLVGYVGDNNDVLTPYGDLGMHYRPGFDLVVPSDSTSLKLSANVDFIQYMGVENEGTTEHDRIGAEADASVTFNQKGNVYVQVDESFRRSDQTSMMILAVGTITDYNQARIRLGIQPGAKSLVIEPGYSLTFEHFESYEAARNAVCPNDDPTCDADSANAYDYLNHTAHLDATWKFLPKTALVFESAYSKRSYVGELKSTDGTSGTTRPLEKYGTDNVRVMAGLSGLVAPKVSLTVKGGWGDQLQGRDAAFKSAIGQAEAGFLLSEQFQFHAGYLRTFEPNPTEASLYYSDDRVYGNVQAKLGEKLTIEGEAAYDRIGFGAERDDDVVAARLGPSYAITPWLEGAVGFALTSRESSIDDPLWNYDRNEFYARIKALY